MLESHAEAINEEVQRQVQEKISALNLKSPEKPKSPERRSAGNAKPSLPTSQQLATMTATDIYALLDTASPTKQEIISSRLRAIASISEINENVQPLQRQHRQGADQSAHPWSHQARLARSGRQ